MASLKSISFIGVTLPDAFILAANWLTQQPKKPVIDGVVVSEKTDEGWTDWVVTLYYESEE